MQQLGRHRADGVPAEEPVARGTDDDGAGAEPRHLVEQALREGLVEAQVGMCPHVVGHRGRRLGEPRFARSGEDVLVPGLGGCPGGHRAIRGQDHTDVEFGAQAAGQLDAERQPVRAAGGGEVSDNQSHGNPIR